MRICQASKCKHWSQGTQNENGILGGYGCGRYLTAASCPITKIQDVTATQYELWIDDRIVTPAHELLINLAVSHLYYVDRIELRFKYIVD